MTDANVTLIERLLADPELAGMVSSILKRREAERIVDVMEARAAVRELFADAVGPTADERGITRLAGLLVEQVKMSPGLSFAATLRTIRGNGGTWSKRHERDALKQAESRGQIRTTAGKNGAVLLYPVGPR